MTKKDVEFLENALEVYYQEYSILLPEKLEIINFIKFIDENLDSLNEADILSDEITDEVYGREGYSEENHDSNEYSFDSLLQKHSSEGCPDVEEYPDNPEESEISNNLNLSDELKSHIDDFINREIEDELWIRYTNNLVKSIKKDIKSYTNIFNADQYNFREMFPIELCKNKEVDDRTDFRVVPLREVLDIIKAYKIKREN